MSTKHNLDTLLQKEAGAKNALEKSEAEIAQDERRLNNPAPGDTDADLIAVSEALPKKKARRAILKRDYDACVAARRNAEIAANREAAHKERELLEAENGALADALYADADRLITALAKNLSKQRALYLRTVDFNRMRPGDLEPVEPAEVRIRSRLRGSVGRQNLQPLWEAIGELPFTYFDQTSRK